MLVAKRFIVANGTANVTVSMSAYSPTPAAWGAGQVEETEEQAQVATTPLPPRTVCIVNDPGCALRVGAGEARAR